MSITFLVFLESSLLAESTFKNLLRLACYMPVVNNLLKSSIFHTFKIIRPIHRCIDAYKEENPISHPKMIDWALIFINVLHQLIRSSC